MIFNSNFSKNENLNMEATKTTSLTGNLVFMKCFRFVNAVKFILIKILKEVNVEYTEESCGNLIKVYLEENEIQNKFKNIFNNKNNNNFFDSSYKNQTNCFIC